MADSKPLGPKTHLDMLDLIFLVWLLITLQHFLSVLWGWSGKAAGLLGELAFLVGVIAYLILRRQSMSLLKPGRLRIRVLPPTVLISISAVILLDEIERIVTQYLPQPEGVAEAIAGDLAFNNLTELAMVLGGSVVAAAVIEEMIFRGLIQKTLILRSNPTAATLTTSLIFALIHFQPSWFIPLLIFSVLAGYLSWRSGSLIPAMLFHGLNNFWTFTLILNLFPVIMPWYLWRGHVHPVLLMAAWFCLRAGLRWFNSLPAHYNGYDD